MSSAPSVCECRFCGEPFEPSGIKNHETHCDANPNPGVPVEQQKKLGIYEEPGEEIVAETEREADADAGGADPDQRASVTDGGATLPPRDTLPSSDKSPGAGESVSQAPEKCPKCGSTDTVPAHAAREKFAEELGEEMPAGLRATLDAGEEYCNGCFSVFGGRYDEPWPIQRAR